ncbi:MAG: tetratricopeptide repeat protein [Prolixibacteraceae bacterium]
MHTDEVDLIIAARSAWKQGEPAKALELLAHASLVENAGASFLSGEIHYSSQNWGAALNCFRRCLQIDPDLTTAQTYVDLILNILGFFHTDQFNP